MYNRYLPHDRGEYLPFSSSTEYIPPKETKTGRVSSILNSLLDRLKIEKLDNGDLLLAAILLLLYLDSKDEEYLFALALFFLL